MQIFMLFKFIERNNDAIIAISMMMLNNILRKNSVIALEALQYRESNVENL